MLSQTRTTKQTYEFLKTDREPYLQRALLYTSYTIKSLLASQTPQNTSAQDMSVGYSTRGPQLVNHLSNSYVLTLFPPHRSFHKLVIDPDEKDQIVKSDENPKGIDGGTLEYQLSRYENKSRILFEKIGCRKTCLEILKHLIVIGNCLLVFPDLKINKDGKTQVYALDEYVVRRDLDGNLMEIVLLDQKALWNLVEPTRSAVAKELGITDPEAMKEKNVDLYTHIQKLANGSWQVHQDCESINVTEAYTVDNDSMRWIPQGWNFVRREPYARSHVEDYAPVFHASEILNEALITGSAIALDFKFLVDPASPTDIQHLNNSATGTYHYGRKGDISLIERANSGDIMAIDALAQRMETILSQAFLWNAPRNAERVTAEEIRLMARELERSHGGVFGSLADSLQRPLAELIMQRVDIKFGKSSIEPMIITGLDALGRSTTNEQIAMVFQDMAAASQIPGEIIQVLNVNWTSLFKVLCAGRDVDTSSIVFTEKEIKAKMAEEKKKEEDAIRLQAELQNGGQGGGQQPPSQPVPAPQ